MPFIMLLNSLLNLYIWVIIIGAVLSWLMMFNVINGRNEFVQGVGRFCYGLTEPALRRIRRFIPLINGIDLSPIALIALVQLVSSCLSYYIAPLFLKIGI